MESPSPRDDEERGQIFNIQRYSLHDGSGIRTLVFLKGCPMRCLWCSNPEGQSCAPQLAYDERKCIGRSECGDLCRKACNDDAIRARDDGKVSLDLGRCTACGDCVAVCPPRALRVLGEWKSVDEVLRIVEEDSPFYARSAGGLTLSGGEPLLQAAFAERLLEAAERRGIDTAIETSGCVPWHDVERVCRHARQIFYDVKSLDDRKHRSATGIGNERILGNLHRLCSELPGHRVVVRTPVVPGFNDSPDEIRAIAELVHSLPGCVGYEILPYHRFGAPKYGELGRAHPLPDVAPPSEEQTRALSRIAEEGGAGRGSD